MTGAEWTTLIVAIFASFMGASGFWAYMTNRTVKHNATTKLLLGLAHDRIVATGMEYIERGWITKDEYDDFITYLYEPYSKFGGNGLADRVKREVSQLKIIKEAPPPERLRDERTIDP